MLPPAVLQPGANHRQRARGLDSLISALFTVSVRPPRISITECEIVSGYNESMQLCVSGYGIIIRSLQTQISDIQRIEGKKAEKGLNSNLP